MQRILVIGFGNPHRGDDGFGFRAAEQFHSMNHNPIVEVMPTQELKPELAQAVSRVDLVIFLDACEQGVPGTVRVCELMPQDRPEGLFSHELTPETLLAAAKILYGRCPEAVMLSVAGENFSISAQLSPAVQAALPRVFDRMKQILAAAKDREPVVLRSEHGSL